MKKESSSGISGVTSISRNSPAYPSSLIDYLGDNCPGTIKALGNIDILNRRKLAVFCSIKCPGRLILETYDLMQKLRDAGITVISGFHSPMEKECLNLLLRGSQPIIICPARSIDKFRLPSEWRPALDKGRLLLLSPFDENQRRATEETALIRNQFVAALADDVFVAYAEPGGKTEAFCREVVRRGKRLLTLDCEHNRGLLAMGAEFVENACKRSVTIDAGGSV